MAAIRPFCAVRPTPAAAARVAAVPYDVVTTEEAHAQADGNPLSFLRVSRAELELPLGTDPYSDAVYDRAVENFKQLKESALLVESEPSVYVYRLTRGNHQQVGVAACFSLDEYDHDLIKKHERTKRDKEDDRTRHMLALGAQTGPVFLVYRAASVIDALTAEATAADPLFDFDADDLVRHTVWRVTGVARDRLVAAFASVPALYIADGHHRAASAARARHDIRDRRMTRTTLGDQADYTTFLGVAFPHDQALILPYNKVVKDLGTLSPSAFMKAVGDRFEIAPGPATPKARGEIAMYHEGTWYKLGPRERVDSSDPIRSLDVSLLHEGLLAPVLNVTDIRTDKRVDFVGGARGTSELERLVDAGQAAVAFSLYPVGVEELMRASDAGEIMPPKSTWFEPKLRDGLLIHLI